MSLAPIEENQKIRFVVRNAEEAVARLRERFGEEGEVLSVKQVRSSGLRSLLTAPQLEVIARRRPAAPSAPSLSRAETGPSAEASALEISREDADGRARRSEGETSPAIDRKPWMNGRRKTARSCRQFLEEAGFAPELLARLEGAPEWRSLQELSPEEGLPKAAAWLRRYAERVGRPRVPRVLAFIGGAGAGKTTAICKLLARDVFEKGIKPQVVRLEVDKPHLDNGLNLYADIFGVECLPSPADIDPQGQEPVYIDIPGFALQSEAEQGRIREVLDDFGITGRIFVQNAAYGPSVHKRFSEVGRLLNVTHQVYTHLDELVYFGDLWTPLLDIERPILFFSTGPNVAADYVDERFDYLLSKTFPL
ncbi:hypothetical protein H5P28_12220 [Ruficoccus amylovorans]|uniref:Flagellar biosynthesis protein FlhF n=1 Tax=Ruficoccus amylovorans TaxID=1804625 RepID=A0A842HHI1_9BACT|nr:hypothetical protein [Ruficoccus amylovorans]MBC2595024.1 hypothetical protein [Ruficoccus amylovorans]